MARKKGKPVNFDVMVKFFLHQYNIPTKKDLDKILSRLDQLEEMFRNYVNDNKGQIRNHSKIEAKKTDDKSRTATDAVLNVIKESDDGVNFAEIKTRTGFKEKKIRNIIYRMDKNGKIKRLSRGIYTAV